MPDYRLSAKAEEDIKNIWRTIARDNEPAADALLLRMFEKVDRLRSYPHLGIRRPDLSATARIVVEGNYIIIYEPRDAEILIVSVVHGGRDVENWL